jgi:hypothetical protein
VIYVKVQVGDGSISKDENLIVHNLGTLDWSIYGCISDKHVTDEIIITEEQLSHIQWKHPEAFEAALHYVQDVLMSPDYIIRDKRPNTGLVIKRIPCDADSMLLVLRISTVEDKEGYKNSLITSWKITEKRLNNYLRNKEVIYKNE